MNTTTPVAVTVFGKASGCYQCITTKKHLDKQGTPYHYRDVTSDPDAAQAVRALGYLQAPVVTAGDMHWSGYSPDKCDQLGRLHTQAADIADLDNEARHYLAAHHLTNA